MKKKKQYITPQIECIKVGTEGVLALSSGGPTNPDIAPGYRRSFLIHPLFLPIGFRADISSSAVVG